MQAALHERSTGSANASLRLIELPRPEPHADEVRVRLCWSGVNPGDVQGGCDEHVHLPALAGIEPHHDGAGVIDAIGAGVSPQRLGERVCGSGTRHGGAPGERPRNGSRCPRRRPWRCPTMWS